MKATMTSPRQIPVLALVLGLTLTAADARAQDTYSQDFTLQPGWNAIYLEVQPEPGDSDSVFGGLPISSAWTWNPRLTTVEFVQDPADGLLDQPGWIGFFPSHLPEAFLTNMFAVQANRAYLLKVEGSSAVAWTVTGRPSARATAWVADSFNLRGFHVDPAVPPTFGNFLAPAAAHAGQPIYQLDSAGVWQQVIAPFGTQIVSGEAYWVYSDGPSDYQGPIAVDVEIGDGLDYGGTLSRRTIRLRNVSDSPASVNLRQQSSSTPVELSVYNFDEDTGEISYPTFPSELSRVLAGGEELLLDLSIRRGDFASDYVASILEVDNGAGYRRLVPVSANTTFAPESATSTSAFGHTKSGGGMAGLWVGTVSITDVSDSQTGSTTPTPTGKELNFRLLLHVAADDNTRLLKEVIMMWQDGTLQPDADDPTLMTLDQRGHYVLLTDDSLIPDFESATLRDGQPVGLRISTVAYDFAENDLPMTGSFGGTLGITLTLPQEFPTNPFRHTFHPDHDNLDALGGPLEIPEVYEVTRTMTLTFQDPPPRAPATAQFEESMAGGVFTETLSGLHKNDIVVEGTFLLRRASAVAVLNQ